MSAFVFACVISLKTISARLEKPSITLVNFKMLPFVPLFVSSSCFVLGSSTVCGGSVA